MKEHKAPWECFFGKEDKNKCKTGAVPKSDREYFEIMSLCIFQAGLNWGSVRKMWPKLRHSFYNFNIDTLLDKKPHDILKNPNVIRNPKKVKAIIENAKRFKLIKKEFGTFAQYLQSLKTLRDKEAIKRLANEFNHFGEYSSEYFLHSVGYWK